MLYDMLVAGGRRAVLCGNIGEPVLGAGPPVGRWRWRCPASSCSGAVAAPGGRCGAQHRRGPPDWHGGFEAYAAAKARAGGAGGRGGLDDPRRRHRCRRPRRRSGRFRLGSRRRGTRRARRGAGRPGLSDDLVLAEAAGIPVAGPVGAPRRVSGPPRLARAVDVPPDAIATALKNWVAGTAPRRSARSAASPTSTTWPPTRTRRRRRSWPIRGWSGRPAACSRRLRRGHRPGSRAGWLAPS